jgi:Type II secretion system (T2SS), protein G
MKPLSTCLLIVSLSGLVHADEKETEEQAKAVLETANKVVEAMKTVKDKASAEKAKPELEKLLTAAIKAQEAFRNLPEADRKKVLPTYRPKIDEVMQEFGKESERLRKDESVMEVLKDLAPFKAIREARLQQAKLMVLNLDKAMQIYKLTTGDYPKSLEAMAEGEKPLLDKKHLKDPWGRAFQYDLKGERHKGVKPDVWSLGPPDMKDALIGNWNTKLPELPKEK